MPAQPARSTIYVVDDDLGVLGSLRFLLETDGFEVKTFRSGAALLSAVAETPVDCIVMDYKMPNMNGIDLATRLRDNHVHAPIVMITGYPDESISARAAAAGVHHVVMKPHLESLVAHIRGAMHEAGSAA